MQDVFQLFSAIISENSLHEFYRKKQSRNHTVLSFIRQSGRGMPYGMTRMFHRIRYRGIINQVLGKEKKNCNNSSPKLSVGDSLQIVVVNICRGFTSKQHCQHTGDLRLIIHRIDTAFHA